MKKWFVASAVAALCLVTTVALAKVYQITASGQSVNISVGGASQVQLDSTSDDFFVFVGGKTVSFELEPDAEGAEELCEVEVYSCHSQDTDSCSEFYWDADFDGTPDTNVLDGVTLGQRLVEEVRAPFYLYFDTTVAPSTGVCILSISAAAEGL